MLTLLMAFALSFARTDTISANDLEVVVPQADGLGVALQRNLEGEVIVRLVGGPRQRRGDQTLLTRFNQFVIPDVKFANVFAIGPRAFGTLLDGRVVEIAVGLGRRTKWAGGAIDKLATGGLGGGTVLIATGLLNGGFWMTTAGAVLAGSSALLPRTFPAVGREFILEYHVEVLGGDHPYRVVETRQDGLRIVDLTVERGGVESSLQDLLRDKKDCSYLLKHEIVRRNGRPI